MAIIKCKQCGGDLDSDRHGADGKYASCECCHNPVFIPRGYETRSLEQAETERLERARKRVRGAKNRIAVCLSHIVGLRSDGRMNVIQYKKGMEHIPGAAIRFDNDFYECLAISAGTDCIFSLMLDGTVTMTGGAWLNVSGKETFFPSHNLPFKFKWEGVGCISSTLIGVGDEWRDLLFGVHASGRVLCWSSAPINSLHQVIPSWTNIVAVDAGAHLVAGLKSDGTVVVADYREEDCYDPDDLEKINKKVRYWRDIVAISVGRYHIVGLKKDGTVVAADTIDNYLHELDVSSWTDIVDVCAGDKYTAGVRTDGTVVMTPHPAGCDQDTRQWRDIVAIYSSSRPVDLDNSKPCEIIGVKADGTVVISGSYSDTDRIAEALSTWKLFNSAETSFLEFGAVVEQRAKAELEKRKAEEAAYRAKQEAEAAAHRAKQEAEAAAHRAKLESEQDALQKELAKLKGLFSGKRRREIEARLDVLEKAIKRA